MKEGQGRGRTTNALPVLFMALLAVGFLAFMVEAALPVTYTVTVMGDAGQAGDLRSVLAAVDDLPSGGDFVVTFAAPGTITLTSPLVIDTAHHGLLIDGDLNNDGLPDVALQLSDEDLFDVVDGPVTFRGLAFDVGLGSAGVVLDDASAVVVEDSIFVGDDSGNRGIVLHGSSDVLVEDSTFRNLYSAIASADDDASVTSIDNTFVDGGGAGPLASQIAMVGGGHLKSTSDSFQNNDQPTYGSAILTQYVDVEIGGDEFIDNTGGSGGAVYAGGSIHTTVDVSGSYFRGNEATVDGGGMLVASSSTNGLGFLGLYGMHVEMGKNTFIGNVADQEGGGAAVEGATVEAYLAKNLFEGNVSDGGGAGLKVEAERFASIGDDFRGNDLRNGDGGDDDGGGAALVKFPTADGNALFWQDVFEGNVAQDADGGALAFVGQEGDSAYVLEGEFLDNFSDRNGGGVLAQGADLEVQQSSFRGDYAADRGANIIVRDSEYARVEESDFTGTASPGADVYISNSEAMLFRDSFTDEDVYWILAEDEGSDVVGVQNRFEGNGAEDTAFTNNALVYARDSSTYVGFGSTWSYNDFLFGTTMTDDSDAYLYATSIGNNDFTYSALNAYFGDVAVVDSTIYDNTNTDLGTVAHNVGGVLYFDQVTAVGNHGYNAAQERETPSVTSYQVGRTYLLQSTFDNEGNDHPDGDDYPHPPERQAILVYGVTSYLYVEGSIVRDDLVRSAPATVLSGGSNVFVDTITPGDLDGPGPSFSDVFAAEDDFHLLALRDNGGQVMTVLPGIDSPALNIGDDIGDFDARGFPFQRVIGPASDAGAAEAPLCHSSGLVIEPVADCVAGPVDVVLADDGRGFLDPGAVMGPDTVGVGMFFSRTSFGCQDADTVVPVFMEVTSPNCATVTDRCVSQMAVVDNTAPDVVCVHEGYFLAQLGSDGTVTVDASAFDGGSSDNCGLPGGLSIVVRDPQGSALLTPSTGSASFTATCDEAGERLDVTMTAVDSSGNAASCLTSLYVFDKESAQARCQEGVALVLGEGGVVNATLGELDAGSDDNCELADLLLAWRNPGDSGWLVGDAVPLSCDNVLRPLTFLIQATDWRGQSTTCVSAVAAVDADPPVAVCPAVFVADLLHGGQTNPITADAIGSRSHDNCAIASWSMEMDGKDLWQGTVAVFRCQDMGSEFPTHLTVTDTAGLSSQCSTVVRVEDTTPPSYECEERVVVKVFERDGLMVPFEDIFPAYVSDNCPGAVNVTLVEVDDDLFDVYNLDDLDGFFPFTCDMLGDWNFDFEMTDLQGNTAECRTIVRVTAGVNCQEYWKEQYSLNYGEEANEQFDNFIEDNAAYLLDEYGEPNHTSSLQVMWIFAVAFVFFMVL